MPDLVSKPEPYDDGDLGAWDIPDSESGWCDACSGTGEVDCYCGGDLCVCANHGTMPCPHCDAGR